MRQLHGLETLGNEHPVTERSAPAGRRSLNWSVWKAWELAFNPLNTELNPIFHLLALLGVHHILHVSRIWVKEPSTGCLEKVDNEILFAIDGRGREREPRNACRCLAGKPVDRRERRYSKDLKVYHKKTAFHVKIQLRCLCICLWLSNSSLDSSKYISSNCMLGR